MMWDKNTFNLVSSSQGEFSITCIFQMVDRGFTWAFSGVYGPQDRADKLRFWRSFDELEMDGLDYGVSGEISMKFYILKNRVRDYVQ